MTPHDFFAFKKLNGGSYPPSNYAYDANNNTEYVGIASEWGASDSACKWTIFKLTLNGVGNPTRIRSTKSYVVWDNYLTETYG